jgi:hypothetical protein
MWDVFVHVIRGQKSGKIGGRKGGKGLAMPVFTPMVSKG